MGPIVPRNPAGTTQGTRHPSGAPPFCETDFTYQQDQHVTHPKVSGTYFTVPIPGTYSQLWRFHCSTHGEFSMVSPESEFSMVSPEF